MTEEGIYLFLSALGIDTSKIKKSNDGKWLSMICPIAFHTHHYGEDKHPSFFISIADEGPSFYNCFGCSDQGRQLIRLLQNMWLMTGDYPHLAAKIYTQYEIHDLEEEKLFEYIDIWDTYKPLKKEPLPEKVIDKYPLLQTVFTKNALNCKKYLLSRGIPENIWSSCKVRYDVEKNNLVFPFTNILGEVYMLRVRSIAEKKIWTISQSIPEFSDVQFPTIRDVGIFFGMEFVDFSKAVIIVEAPIDGMRLKALGCSNVVASGTSMITYEQVHSICSESIIMGFDNDLAGEKARKRVLKYIGEDIIVSDLKWSLVNSIKEKPCKDAAELVCKKDLIKVLKNKITY